MRIYWSEHTYRFESHTLCRFFEESTWINLLSFIRSVKQSNKWQHWKQLSLIVQSRQTYIFWNQRILLSKREFYFRSQTELIKINSNTQNFSKEILKKDISRTNFLNNDYQNSKFEEKKISKETRINSKWKVLEKKNQKTVWIEKHERLIKKEDTKKRRTIKA